MPEESPQATVEQPAEPPYGAAEQGRGFDTSLLVIFLVVLAGVIASNVWLRRRNQGAEGDARDE